MGIFQNIITSIKEMFNKKNTQPGYKLDLTSNTFEAKRARDTLADQRPLNVSNAYSWNKETHPQGEGPSYLVNNINYDPSTQKLDVTYRNGFSAEYNDITTEQAKDFITTDSKGRWAHKNLWKLPYKAI